MRLRRSAQRRWGTEIKVEVENHSSVLPLLSSLSLLSLSGTIPYESHPSPVPLQPRPPSLSLPHALRPSAPPPPFPVPTRRRKASGSALSPFSPLPSSPTPRSHASPPCSSHSPPSSGFGGGCGGAVAIRPCPSPPDKQTDQKTVGKQ